LVESFFIADFWIDFLPKSLCRFCYNYTFNPLPGANEVVGSCGLAASHSMLLTHVEDDFHSTTSKAFKPLTRFSLLTSSSFQFSYPPRALKIWLKSPFYVPKLPFKVFLSMYLLSPASNLFY
jgi:hypothetical protein